MNRSQLWSTRFFLIAALLCAPACAEISDSEDELGELSEELDGTITVTVTSNAPAWPRVISFTGDHPHAPYLWQSISGEEWTSTPTLTKSVNTETCNVSAHVVRDTPPSGLGHSSINAPSINAIDARAFTAAPASQTVSIGATAYLSVPAPHATGHCDNQGRFSWEMFNSFTSTWRPVENSTSWNPAHVTSPTAGSQTYRIRCDHTTEGTHYGSPMTVTWVAAPNCSVTCQSTSYPSVNCTVNASGGIGSYSYFANYKNQGWVSVNNPSVWLCKTADRYTVTFKARDSAGNECMPTEWSCNER